MHAVALVLATLAWLAASADPALAGPITAAVGAVVGAIGITGTAAAIATTAISAALVIGAQVGLSLLFGPQKPKPGGSTFQLEIGGDRPRAVPFGRVGTEGHLVYWNTYGDGNDWLQLVFALADWECDGLEEVWINGKLYQLNDIGVAGTEDARFRVNGFDNRITVRWFAGRPDQVADDELVSRAKPADRWTSTDRLSGICYVSLSMRHDPDVFPSGIPSFKWVIRGAKVYDPRQDSTAGGTGPQRWHDHATWEWSENPAPCLYTYLRGLSRTDALGHEQRVLGMGVPGADLLSDMFMSAANVGDEEVIDGGDPVTRYTCALIATDDVEHRTAIESFCQAMAGYLYEKAGSFGAVPGAAQVPIADLTTGDLAVGYGVRWRAKRSRAQLVNYLSGAFTDPQAEWGRTSYPPVTNEAWEIEDDGPIRQSMDLPSISSPWQAARVAEVRLRETRMQATAEVTVGIRWVGLEPGDWVTFDYKGLRAYRVMSKRENEDRTVTLELAEIDATVYGEDAPTIPPRQDTPAAPPDLLTQVQGLAASAVLVHAGAGQQIPAIHLVWDPILDATVTELVLQYRVFGSTVSTEYVFPSPEVGEAYLQEGIAAQTDYEVRANFRATPDRPRQWTEWVDTLTEGEPPQVGVDFQIFDEEGEFIWIKPPGLAENALVVVEGWGRGGNGGYSSIVQAVGNGGGGGAYQMKLFRAGDLPDTVPATVAGQSGAADTSFGAFLTVYGGGTAINPVTGGHGGGWLGLGPNAGGGAAGGAAGSVAENTGGFGSFGGGGGGGADNNPVGADPGNGGPSAFGGGGGACCNQAQEFRTGGDSVYGGRGGDIGQDGEAPAGGGGGGFGSIARGLGARGELRVWVVR